MTSTDPLFYLAIALTTLATTGILAVAGLSGWNAWLMLKRSELDMAVRSSMDGNGTPGAMARIELADLKERIRKLEAIAAGVDL